MNRKDKDDPTWEALKKLAKEYNGIVIENGKKIDYGARKRRIRNAIGVTIMAVVILIIAMPLALCLFFLYKIMGPIVLAVLIVVSIIGAAMIAKEQG